MWKPPQNAERLQNQQLVAIRTAIVEQGKTASEIGSARTHRKGEKQPRA
jgi:hypothetical protein